MIRKNQQRRQRSQGGRRKPEHKAFEGRRHLLHPVLLTGQVRIKHGGVDNSSDGAGSFTVVGSGEDRKTEDEQKQPFQEAEKLSCS